MGSWSGDLLFGIVFCGYRVIGKLIVIFIWKELFKESV